MAFRQIIDKLNHRSTPLLPEKKFFKLYFLLLVVISSIFLVKNIFAQSNPYLDKSDAIKAGNNQENWLDEALGSNMVSIFNGMTGGIPKEVFQAYADDKSPKYAFIPGGALGNMNTLIASLNTPPASGIEYLAQVKDSFLGKPAYAQGVGFKGLQFLLPLWRGFRNLVYVLTSIIFIVIGIMIMLRVKISPQAVVTVQSAIPKLITTLILVTFSYAIAGLVIDLCNFIQALVVALLFSVNGSSSLTGNLLDINKWFGKSGGFPILGDLGDWLASLFGGNFSFKQLSNPNLHTMQLLTYRAVPGWGSLVLLGGLLGSIIVGFFLGGAGNAILGATGSSVFDIVGRVVGGVVGGLVGGLIIPIILCIIVGIWLIKLYFGLLKNYVTLIFKIIFAPLEIAMGAFPNAKIGFSTWLLDVVSNMAVFPIVGIFLVVLNLVVDAVSSSGSIISPVWAPSLISAGGITPSIIAAAIGLAGLAMISKLPELVPQYIFMIKPSPFGQAIGEGLDISKTPVIGGVIRGTQKEMEERSGRQVIGTGTELVGKTTSKVAKVLNKWKSRDSHPEDDDDHGESIGA